LESIVIKKKKGGFPHPVFATQTRKEQEGRVQQDIQIWSILQGIYENTKINNFTSRMMHRASLRNNVG